MKKSNYEFIVGADVSKATLDYTILRGKDRIAHTQIENSPKGLKKLENNLRKKNIPLSKTLICCENTGRHNYSNGANKKAFQYGLKMLQPSINL